MTDDDAFKALADKVGHMDGRLNMAEKDISRFDRTHELTPHRLTLLEQQYENLTRQLASIGTMLSSISEKQDAVGRKIAYGMGAAAVVLFLLDKFLPAVAKVVGS
jgi:septal ring factor EnvC (AmiA/AmiB activator)